MKYRGIHHVGVAVKDLEASLSRWSALFGARPGPVEVQPARGVRLSVLTFPEGPAIELVSPLDENSPVARFLEKRGEGIHHFTLEVDDIEGAMAWLRAAGLELVSATPQSGTGDSLVAFVHPRSLNGVLLELRQQAKRD